MASALLHVNLSQLKNDGAIGMGSEHPYNVESFDSSFSSDNGPVKRDLEDELDKCQVKKRRKQSKPIRIASTESLVEDNEGKVVEQSSEDFSNCQIFSKKDDTKCKDDSDEECSNEETGNESLSSDSDVRKEPSHPLNLSHSKSISPKDSVESLPVSNWEERNWYKPPEAVTSSLYPLSSLDHSSLKSHVYPYNLLLPSQNPGLVPSNFKRIFVGANNENQISSPHRIFNPEAFCDLCNKEFCNKYFLKTHKANKHGIYTDNLSATSMETMPPLPIVSYFSSNLANLPLPATQGNKKPSNGYGHSSSKSSSSSMRAFCNICQREFCNKYFVRRHKAKIHGIVENTEETSQEYKAMNNTEKQEDLGMPGPSGKHMDVSKTQMGIKDDLEYPNGEEKLQTSREQDNEAELADSPQNAFNFLVSSWQCDDIKDSPEALDQGKKALHSNNSAFCDICCKEYCNKYFLRIHKQKCHGIVLTDKDEKPKEPNLTSSWKPNQPMPLNLILRETNLNVNEADSVFTCNQCDMSFSEQHLLKMHCNLVHNLTLQDSQILNKNSLFYGAKDPIKSTPKPSSKNTPDPPKSHHPIDGNEMKYFSSDVQRLHAMIAKLNQPNQMEVFYCDICNKDFGQNSALENHIIREHSALLEEISNGFYEDNQNFHVGGNKWECLKCQSTFQSSSLLDIHLNEKHSIFDSKLPCRNGEENLEVGNHLSNERSLLHTPTSSFCEICKKELCNKYFMKTHMQRMHGISIENGAHIGGVVCDICNKELCSKYFLRVHKQNSHGIVEEAFLPQVGNDIKGQTPNIDAALKPSDNELSNRYFSHFTEVCTICSRRFRSVKWLKTHLLNDHGEDGKEKWKELQLQNGNKPEKVSSDSSRKNDNFCCLPFRTSSVLDNKANEPSTSSQQCDAIKSMLNKTTPAKSYQCTYCSFSTGVLALLFVHERTHFSQSSDQEFSGALSLSPKNASEVKDQKEDMDNSISCCSKDVKLNHSEQYEYPSIQNEKEEIMNEDNNFSDVKDKQICHLEEAGIKCLKCPYSTPQLKLFLEHMQNDHKSADGGNYLQIVCDALLHLASTSLVPASFALPSSFQNKFTMQPFVIEDNSNSTFVSSVVFLPVREKISAPVTASFRLTPT